MTAREGQRTSGLGTVAVLAALMGLLAVSVPADATAPGANGLIAYVEGGDIWVMNPDGSAATNLTNDGATFDDSQPSWSPGGTMIAFASDRAGNSEIFTMTAAGGAITNRTNSAAFELFPDWSTDNRIAFTATPQLGTAGDIWVMDSDGSNPSNVTQSGTGEAGPAWSPDASRIAFVRGVQDGCQAEIFVMNSDGTNEQRLTCEIEFTGHLSWSPDGSRISFWVGFGTNVDIGVVPANGGPVSRIVDTCCVNLDPAWSPDGTRIVYAGSTFETSGTYMVNPDGSSPARVADARAGYDWQPLRERGDPDCSGTRKAADGERILRFAGGMAVQEVGGCPQIGSALEGGGVMGDVNCDGSVNGLDALDVFRSVAGLPQLPNGC